MFNNTVLEVALGLVFCYASVSLIVSSINEAIASAFRLRAATLLKGVKLLLNDPNFEGLARDVYNHALVNPPQNGQAKTEEDLSHTPSYIPGEHFANALLDALQRIPSASAKLDEKITAIKDPQLRQLLLGIYARTGGDLQKLQSEFAAWFDNGMDRLSGSYKRRAQLICVLIALVIAAVFNIDSFHLFKTLWENAALAAALPASPPENLMQAIADLKTLPIGWPTSPFELTFTGFLLTFAGWLVTASSALFGAPFWFDLLQNITCIRGTGRKPARASDTA